MYNGSRPATGSTATEDDGVALRERAWAQYKLKVNRWFFWETTYYNDYQGGTGEINVFQSAHTFGSVGAVDPVLGQTGWNYSNGDGVLFYPGTDLVYPSDSYGVDGPFASLRLKDWRRGLQDVDYLTLAAAVNPSAVQALVNAMVPKAAWEYGVDSPSDPTYVHTDISWSDDPQVWERARTQLAELIPQGSGGGTAAANAPHVLVYPNPWRANRNAGIPITFEQPILSYTVNILSNYSGRHVRTLTATNGIVAWDLTSDSGTKVASGTYIYIITFAGNTTTRGRLAIIR